MLPVFKLGASSLALVSLTLAACRPNPVADVVDVQTSDVPPIQDVTDTGPVIGDGATDASHAADVATDERADARSDVPTDGPLPDFFCTAGTDVARAVVPAGFCLRHYATVGEARVLLFAPNGDLFVAAPSTPAPGGAGGGPAAIVVLTDDNHDGVAEQANFATGISDVHGLAMGDGFLYYTTMDDIFRTPYTVGQRREMGTREAFHMPTSFGLGGRWTHGMARSIGGVLYASRGEYGQCGGTLRGDISRVAMGTRTILADGFRNPMYMRCHYRDEACLAAELGEDGAPGAREKLVLIRPDTHYGYGAGCYTTNLAASGCDPDAGAAACATVTPEDVSIELSRTPFGFDWERGSWPAPFTDGLFLALHGACCSGTTGGIVFAPTNPITHVPTGTFTPFLSGFGRPSGGSVLDRPSDVAFAPDGRLFFSDDQGNAVYWMAPTTLRMPAR